MNPLEIRQHRKVSVRVSDDICISGRLFPSEIEVNHGNPGSSAFYVLIFARSHHIQGIKVLTYQTFQYAVSFAVKDSEFGNAYNGSIINEIPHDINRFLAAFSTDI